MICHISSPSILKICPYNNTIITIFIRQTCLSWWLSYLQHVSIAVMQQSRYPVFHGKVLLSYYQCLTTETSTHGDILKSQINPKCYDILKYYSFSFSFIYFSRFYISFYLMMKRHMTMVTWHVTWYEVIKPKMD